MNLATPQFTTSIELDTNAKWHYAPSGQEIRDDLDTDITSTTAYTITIDGDSPETHTTNEPIGHCAMKITNATSTPKEITLSSSPELKHLSFELKGNSSATLVTAVNPGANTPALTIRASAPDDPKFSIKPPKLPPLTQEEGAPDPSITWDGSSWSLSTVTSNPGETLDVVNTSPSAIELVVANSNIPSEQSYLTIPLPHASTTKLTFGDGCLLRSGFFEIDDKTATLQVLDPLPD